jgi:uncharacterized protein DUF4231
MNPMTEQDYLDQRIDDQIGWYSKKSTFNKKRYQFIKTLVIIISASIPVLAIMITGDDEILKIAVGVAGVSIVVLEGILSHYKYKDIWLKYRMTSEMLNREKILYLTSSGPYKTNKTLQSFVERSETIMSTENQNWLTDQLKTEDPKNEDS